MEVLTKRDWDELDDIIEYVCVKQKISNPTWKVIRELNYVKFISLWFTRQKYFYK